MEPENLQEWIEYIRTEIPTLELISQAQSIGSASFQNQLQQEGYTSEDLLAIYRAVAIRFVEEGLRIPDEMDDCLVNFREISMYDPDNPLNLPKKP